MPRRAPPPLRFAEEQKDDLREWLLGQYQLNVEFMAELESLRRRYERLLRVLVTWRRARSYGTDHVAVPAEAWRGAKLAAQERYNYTPDGRPRNSRSPHLNGYIRQLESLATAWGLRAPWVPAWLHAAIVEQFALAKFGETGPEIRLGRPLRSYGWSAPDLTIDIEFEFGEEDSWELVRERVVERASERWKTVQKQLSESGEWKAGHTRPEVSDHVHWLYLRICPKSDGASRGWPEIGGLVHKSESAVRNAVKGLASELALTLPIVPRGRPRSRR